MEQSQDKFNIRLTLLIGPFAISFFLFLTFGLLKDFIEPNEELEKFKLIIDSLHFNEYKEERILKSDLTHRCFDIKLKGKVFFVRLTDYSHSSKWDEMQKKYSDGDTLEILFTKRLFHDNVVYNPNEIKINNHLLISVTETKKMNLLALIFVMFCLLIFGYMFFKSFKRYLIEKLEEDKILYKENKLKLMKRWLDI